MSRLERNKMSSRRTVFVPRFGSPLDSSQREETQPVQTMMDQTETSSRRKRGNKRGHIRSEKTGFLLKVKLPKLNNSTLSKKVTKEDNTQRRWMVEPAANKTNTTVSQGGAGTDSDSVGRDVFFFSQRPTSTALNDKEKAKLAVLRTVSKMLEENQLIRQRLAAVCQAN